MIECENCPKKYEKGSDKWHVVDEIAICKECHKEMVASYEDDDLGQSEYDSVLDEIAVEVLEGKLK